MQAANSTPSLAVSPSTACGPTDSTPGSAPANAPGNASTTSSTLAGEAALHELQQLKSQLRQAQKLASLGTAAAMLAHEYNNLFAPVVSYAQYALDRDDIALMRKTLNMMLRHSDAVQSMSQRILGLARWEAPAFEAVDLHAVVEDAVGCLGRDLAKDNISLTIEVDPALRVRGHRNQLQQVLFNLVLNARQAMIGRSGRLKISATPISDQAVAIHVRDNGRGITAANLKEIFSPFFSTKQNEERRERRGLGLGLAICKDIIDEHGGTIAVDSIEGSGTTFTITLPAAM